MKNPAPSDTLPFTIYAYETTDSTNEEAKRLYQAGVVSSLSAVIADEQTAGKGTQGRQWVSPKNAGVYLTIIHTEMKTGEMPSDLPLTHLYTQAAGLACVETLQELFGLNIQLKPVNDLYIRCPKNGAYKKLGGILVESLIQEGQLKALLTGIGINLAAVERSLNPAQSVHPEIVPISLEELLDSPKWQQLSDSNNRKEFLSNLITRVDDWYKILSSGQDDVVTANYQKCVCFWS